MDGMFMANALDFWSLILQARSSVQGLCSKFLSWGGGVVGVDAKEERVDEICEGVRLR